LASLGDRFNRFSSFDCRLPEEVHCEAAFPACPQNQQRYSEISVEIAAWAIIEKRAPPTL
jgi:hypothetical protein